MLTASDKLCHPRRLRVRPSKDFLAHLRLALIASGLPLEDCVADVAALRSKITEMQRWQPIYRFETRNSLYSMHVPDSKASNRQA
ncbi:MAG: hypothetical protein AUG51_22700 [Acidobacteria bacterium 13_1_20CM_3_53_8]|nr:MAG: hypothetical protein AUG51_22700 [Acidobacteria bacterium 13_1_20CM_3_53_8]